MFKYNLMVSDVTFLYLYAYLYLYLYQYSSVQKIERGEE